MTKCPERGLPKQDSVGDLESLMNLIYYREVSEIKSMTEILSKKIMVEGKKFYDVWMHEISDDIQALALAFSERFALENALQQATKVTDSKAKEVLAKAIRLHCLLYVRENLGWYLANGVVSPKAGLALEGEYQQAVKDIVPHVNDIVEGFNIPKIPQLAPPIIRDYIKFNEQSDPDNVEAAGGFFDFTKGPKL